MRAQLQGQGLATEAALACREHAAALGVRHLVAIINPDNVASQKVALKLGMQPGKTSTVHGQARRVYAMDLTPVPTT